MKHSKTEIALLTISVVFIVVMLIVLLIITFVPNSVLFLPKLFGLM